MCMRVLLGCPPAAGIHSPVSDLAEAPRVIRDGVTFLASTLGSRITVTTGLDDSQYIYPSLFGVPPPVASMLQQSMIPPGSNIKIY